MKGMRRNDDDRNTNAGTKNLSEINFGIIANIQAAT